MTDRRSAPARAEEQMATRKTRIAMFVLGDCQNDGRVRKEATALHGHGYDVRLFAMATRDHGPGRTAVDSVPVDRLAATSWPQRLVRLLGRPSTPAPSPPADGAGRLRQRVPRLAAAARDVALRVHRPSLALSYTRLAVAAARAWGPDVVHAHDLPALPAAALVARERGLPLVYDSHELWRRRNRRGQWRPAGRVADALVERSLAPRAAVVVTVCDSIAAWLSRRYDLRRPPVVLRNIPLPSRTSSRDVRALAGLTDERVLLYTGRVMEGRGLEFAVRSLHALPEDVVLVLMGYGDPAYGAALASLAARQGVADRVRMVDAVPAEEVTSVASTADLAYVVIEPVCQSYRYALPSKLFEAIAAGLPVLAADLPEIRRIVVGYGVGVVFTPRAATDLRAALDSALAGAQRYRQAAERARTVLTWRHEQHRLLDAYDRLVPADSQRTVRT